jgi:hypothetical protein
MQKIFFMLLLGLFSQQICAQNIRLGDMGFFSVERPYPVPEKRFKPAIGFDAQNVFIGKRSVRIGGLRLGVHDTELKIKAGLCFYAFNNRLKTDNVYVPEINATTFLESDYGLMTLFVEPTIFENPRFLVSVPVNLGYGQVSQYYGSKIGTLTFYRKFPMGVFSAQVAGQVNVFYWLSFGAGLGYHFSGGADQQIRKEYSGLMFNLRLKIDFFGIYKTVTHYLEKNPR